ncbi:hypothetical protein D1871_06320 [Nakamurella silvestris]|nr:hypothetical protein D1871_06320 [Nakamurella silvestris]
MSLTPEQLAYVAKYNIDLRYNRLDGLTVTPYLPKFCPAGHPMVPGQMTVSFYPCLCQEGHTGHRLWSHDGCDLTACAPACVNHPGWYEWPGMEVEV